MKDASTNWSAVPYITVDGNEATASVAYRLSEVISIYPITPASPMGELSDTWSAAGKPNLWSTVPQVIEMQSEGGAAGALHGALQGGALTTTFTASQGLLLMIPNMFKVSGELLPTVIHVAARSVATHALSIFGDHSDVMAARMTGFAMLASSSVQEAQDMALISHAATLSSRVPFMHFFDGFRTSHEIAKIDSLIDADLRAMVDEEAILAFRARRLSPDGPVIRGTAQNPDVFFQGREAANPYYDALPDIVVSAMDRFHDLTGRRYHLFDYVGAPDAQRVIAMMGSGIGAAEQAVNQLVADGEKVGLLKVRLYRPFSPQAIVAALPPTTISVAVLDRTKEPGAVGEPLYQDVIAALAEETALGRTAWDVAPRVIGGRYGLSSKEFTPPMAMAVLDELKESQPKPHFTVGIVDDVTHLSLKYDPNRYHEADTEYRAVFYGLGSDGTVGANKNSVKIIGDATDMYAQGYFVYDSRKSGSQTVSHLRFGPKPIDSTYLIDSAQFVGVHHFEFFHQMNPLEVAAHGATVLINSPHGDDLWNFLPADVVATVVEKQLDVHVIDASRVASDAGLGGRVNTVLQACFFDLAKVLDPQVAVDHIKKSIRKSYAKFGEVVVEHNEAAVDDAIVSHRRIRIPETAPSVTTRPPRLNGSAPDFVQKVTNAMLEGKGDLLPVSALPADGTFPTGTTKYEKRSIAHEIPTWDPSLCIDCAKCVLVCPHTAIQMKVYDPAFFDNAPAGFQSKPWTGKDFPGASMTIQVAPDDCTGCGVCVDVCPARSKEEAKHKSLDMTTKDPILEQEQANFEYFLGLPEQDRKLIKIESVKGSQMLQPLMEFSGACAGCGETPYLKLLSQLFGDRLTIANATGCSSIYGGNLPTTPWTTNDQGRGPAWANSLFEDNAEFGLGMRLALDQQIVEADGLLADLTSQLPADLVAGLRDGRLADESSVEAQRSRVLQLKDLLTGLVDDRSERLRTVADALVHKTIWIVGGDGWAYDIGFGGLDHVLASGRNVNILVLDTEVYSNTGGQASKATPRAAVAKFAASGRQVGKKDLGMLASAYGDVYVAQVAIGANNTQTVKAFAEAEAYDGPSLIIAYSQCIAHGIDMSTGFSHQKEAVTSGYWPLYRYDPRAAGQGKRPFHLDSRAPTTTFKEFAATEARYAMLVRSQPERAEELFGLAQDDIDARWKLYEQMADVERRVPDLEDHE
ncbi:MAG: pyruvate:ferredoxin (flavodoxin) oxidoreductase [Acidimicrobiia bacterium]|nr:pyruvate:ferredoxin (flavodoxin) oxidoreductase [Acidimicrobiia bacterium]